MRDIDEIIIHCSATEAGRDFSATDIKRWHLEKGWSDIGYHYVIELDGTVKAGRPLEKVGAHARGHNESSIGICYIGGLSAAGDKVAEDTRTDEQRASLRELIDELFRRFPSINQVSGHNEYSNKECPCFDVKAAYPSYRVLA